MTKISDLKFDDKNFNDHTEFGMSLLEKSLQNYGAGRSILIDKNNNIIAGNGIVEAAAQAGIEKVRIVETQGEELVAVKRTDVDLHTQKGREMAFADNATSSVDLSWNKENIGEFFTPEDTEKWGVKFDWAEEQEIEEDEAPEVNEKEPAKSELGKVYHLGEHRLMCGDSTDAGNVAILMNGEKADMVFTDPPYGVNVVGDDGKVGADFGIAKKGVYSKVIADETTETAKKSYAVLKNFSSKMVIWGGNYFIDFLDFSDGWLIWDKRGDTGIRNTFADGEMAWCSFHTPVRIYKQIWNGMIREGEHEQRVHPTQKPIRMLGEILKDFTESKDNILDVFGGSGSTLIACEQLGRKCYMMELDPKYCDVIRKRYWKFINGSEEGWEDGTRAI